MKSKTLLIFMSIIVLSFSVCLGADMNLGRYPALSPNGKYIAFSWHGDIWKVSSIGGAAMRLTDNKGYEIMPVWSPDGRMIAFSAKREGNFDIYIVKSDGSNLKRLTWFSANDYAMDWSRDGQRVLFSSSREYKYYYGGINLYWVDTKGGTPVRAIKNYTGYGKVSPDGRMLAYVRGRFPWWRLHYRGSANLQIWVYDFKRKTHTQVTTFDGTDIWPCWAPDSKHIYYVSEQGGIPNLFSVKYNGKNLRKVTNFSNSRITFPSTARKKESAVFERDGKIWLIEKEGTKAHPVKITAPPDTKTNMVEYKKVSKDATELAVSPNGKEIAFVVRGDIFVMRAKSGKARNITNSVCREKDISWSRDGKSILFVSDESGNDDIFRIYSVDKEGRTLSRSLKFKTERLTSDTDDELMPKYSPDGSKIAYVKAGGDLYVMNRDGKMARCVLHSWNVPDYSWSPDGEWLAFSMNDCEYNSDVYVMPSNGGKPVNITMHPDNDTHPIWSHDGRMIAFTSKRNSDYKIDNVDVYFVYLRKADDEKSEEEWKDEWEDGKQLFKDNRSKKGNKRIGKVKVKIDFENIYLRVRRLTKLPGAQRALAFSPDDRRILFSSNHDGKRLLYTVDRFGKSILPASKSVIAGSVKWNSKSKKIFFLKKGGVPVIWAKNKEVKIGFRAMLMIDHRRERLQKFDEAWRLLNDHFYDPHFHGVDWEKMHDYYRPFAEKAVSIEDFNDVVRMMMGELNSSHMGIYYRVSPVEKVQTGNLGVLLDENYHGPGVKVKNVLSETPAAMEKSRLQPGDFILSIDGKTISPETNYYSLLNRTIGEKVLLKVESSKDSTVREVEITPAPLRIVTNKYYKRWVKIRREIVHKKTKGKIGYIHIQAMGQPSLGEFEMELFSEAHDKEGLIIDVRNNGGGWTTDYILSMLMTRNHATTVGRSSWCSGYPQDRRPLYAFTKPITVLCNQNSYSNAEIFSWSINTLKRGPLVGEQTFGAVISTGAARLIDGSIVRIPGRGWYVWGSHLNMEHHGCMPDYRVAFSPKDEEMERDPQLEKAISVIMNLIRKK